MIDIEAMLRKLVRHTLLVVALCLVLSAVAGACIGGLYGRWW